MLQQHKQEIKNQKLGISSRDSNQQSSNQQILSTSNTKQPNFELPPINPGAKSSLSVAESLADLMPDVPSSEKPTMNLLADLASALKSSTPEKLLSEAIMLDPSIVETFQSILGNGDSGESSSADATRTILSLLTELASNTGSIQESSDASIQTAPPNDVPSRDRSFS